VNEYMPYIVWGWTTERFADCLLMPTTRLLQVFVRFKKTPFIYIKYIHLLHLEAV